VHFSKILNFIWTKTFHLKNILDCSCTWTEFLKIRAGSESQNMTVRSSLLRRSWFKQHVVEHTLQPKGDVDCQTRSNGSDGG